MKTLDISKGKSTVRKDQVEEEYYGLKLKDIVFKNYHQTIQSSHQQSDDHQNGTNRYKSLIRGTTIHVV